MRKLVPLLLLLALAGCNDLSGLRYATLDGDWAETPTPRGATTIFFHVAGGTLWGTWTFPDEGPQSFTGKRTGDSIRFETADGDIYFLGELVTADRFTGHIHWKAPGGATSAATFERVR
jgi:hypothetical protein